MKPMGPIPAGFVSADGHLLIDGHRALDLAEQTPCFVYSKAMLTAQFAALRAALASAAATAALSKLSFRMQICNSSPSSTPTLATLMPTSNARAWRTLTTLALHKVKFFFFKK